MGFGNDEKNAHVGQERSASVREVTETHLPGVGIRHDFTTASGERVGVLVHRSGRRELLLYGRDDPDACVTALHLSAEDTRTLAEVLGATQVSEVLAEVQQRLEGVAIEWFTIPDRSPVAGTTIRPGPVPVSYRRVAGGRHQGRDHLSRSRPRVRL